MADSGGDLDLEAFRVEARTWLAENFPASLKGAGAGAGELEGHAAVGDLALWRKRIGEKGWATPTWPKAYGGGGLSPQPARVLQQEMDRAGAFNPLTFGMGITMIGPTILDYGTEAQKARAHAADRAAARCAGASAIPSRAPARTWPRCRPSARTPAITG
jgi:alkylation response protein AidB-like acyl-CoA dehydrogenase